LRIVNPEKEKKKKLKKNPKYFDYLAHAAAF
jgi:hypothetical protein